MDLQCNGYYYAARLLPQNILKLFENVGTCINFLSNEFVDFNFAILWLLHLFNRNYSAILATLQITSYVLGV